MKAEVMAASLGAVVAGVGQSQNQTGAVPTVHIPLNLRYGPNEKVSTELLIPSVNATIEVVYDQGSENFFLFGPNATANWGKDCLGCRGDCNATVPAGDFFDYPRSASASPARPFSASYIFGGLDKIYDGHVALNDSFRFANAAGQTSAAVDTAVAVVDYLQMRILAYTCGAPPKYDLGILGVSPYYHSANATGRNTTGPAFRQDLLDQGLIAAPVQSLWFDAPPASTTATRTGGGLQGGLDTSKYTGPLIKVPNLWKVGTVGYYVPLPTLSSGGVPIAVSNTSAQSCLIDSGTHNDGLPIANETAFFAATGIGLSPAGHVSWPGTCDSIPADKTVDYTFAGAAQSSSVTVRVPVRAYARYALDEAGYCYLSVDTSGCILGSPFATAAFFAADDERGEIALAQGGVAEPGSGVDAASVVARIP